MKFDPTPLIRAYVSAYEAANGPCPYTITYENGWFRLRSGPWVQKHRRAQLASMTATLQSRARA